MIVKYATSTTIKVASPREESHMYFDSSRTKSDPKEKWQDLVPAISLSPEVFQQADIKTDFVELHFENPAGRFAAWPDS